MDVLNISTIYLEFFLVAAAVVTTIYGLVRWSTKRLEAKIVEVTHPIHPESNGGHSLADLHKKMDMLLNRVDVVEQEGRYTRFVISRLAVGDMDQYAEEFGRKATDA